MRRPHSPHVDWLFLNAIFLKCSADKDRRLGKSPHIHQPFVSGNIELDALVAQVGFTALRLALLRYRVGGGVVVPDCLEARNWCSSRRRV